MRTREQIMKQVNEFAQPGMGIQQQIATSVVSLEVLLDIRETLQVLAENSINHANLED